MKRLVIKYLVWLFKIQKINNIELVIRNDRYTYYKRNKEREESVKEVLSQID